MAFKKIFTDSEMLYLSKYIKDIEKGYSLIYNAKEMLLEIIREQAQRGDIDYSGRIKLQERELEEASNKITKVLENLYDIRYREEHAETKNRIKKSSKSGTRRKIIKKGK